MPRRTKKQRKSRSFWIHLIHPKIATWLFVDGLFFLSWLAIGAAIWFFQSENLQLPSVLGVSSDITASKVYEAINEERAAFGVERLTWNDTLAQAAQAKADDMLARDYWSHITPDGKQPWTFVEASGYHYQVAGENLARSFPSTSAMVQAWMDSPTHRANLLHESYQETGIATVQGVMNGQETTLVVQMFGTPGVAPSPNSLTQVVPARGEISQIAPNIAKWLSTGNTGTTHQSGQGSVLGILNGSSQIMLYRLGMLAIVATAIVLLIMDAFHPRHQKRTFKHPLLHPSRHFVHIALLVATLLTVGLAEAGSLL